MIVQKFNQALEKYSRFLTALRLLRARLALYSTEEIFACLLAYDAEEKGYFTASEIKHIWLASFIDQQQEMQAFIHTYFNYGKISYTIIVDFLAATSKSNPQDNPKSQLSSSINSIFQLSFRCYILQQQIITKMHHFIPMKYSLPSQQEFSCYAICQNITVDLKQISKALNLLQTNLSLRNNKLTLSFDRTLANPSVSNLQDIMKRLQNRVNTFGNEWLTPTPLQK